MSELGGQSYANVMSISAGPYDVTIDFYYRSPEKMDTSDYKQFDRVARISMSVGHAKSMIPIMAKVIGQYEAANGEVPAPGFEQFGKE